MTMKKCKNIHDFIEKKSNPVALYRKLSLLESNWDKLIGPPLSERTAPIACCFTDEGLKITIAVKDNGLLRAVQFRKQVFQKALKKYFSRADIKVEIKVGRVIKQCTAKEAKPDYLRRAPVFYTEETLEKETKRMIKENNLNPELAESMAKLKLTIEKLKSRER